MLLSRLFLIMIFSLLTFAPAIALHAEPDSKNILSSLPDQDLSHSLSEEEPLSFALVAEKTAIKAGSSLWLSLQISHQPQWHSYWKNSGDTGLPLQLEWQLPEGFSLQGLYWPTPQRQENGAMVSYCYEGDIALLAEVAVPNTFHATDSDRTIGVNIRWLACSESSCLPGESFLQLQLPRQNSDLESDEERDAYFSAARQQLPQKGWQLNAYREGSMIALELQLPDKGANPLESADFYPEDSGVVDEKRKIQFLPNRDSADEYLLVFKEGVNSRAEKLRGILLLYSEGGASKALEIDLPLRRERGSAVLGMAEGSEPHSSSVQSLEMEMGVESDGDSVSGVDPKGATFEGGIIIALLLAFVGGAILNLMPCVLPVVSLKILSFVKLAGEKRSAILAQGGVFALGIIASFWLLASAMILLQSYGHTVGWGFQMQSPLFIAALSALLFFFALNMFGVFEIGTSLMAAAGKAQHDLQQNKSRWLGMFCSGMLTTAVATPCTGPFLGTAIGFAATLPALQMLAIFTSLGLGMASPYLLISAFPSLLRLLPKPGAWMGAFKEVVGFLLISTVIWLLWVFASQTGQLSLILLIVSLFFVALSAWVYGRYCAIGRPPLGKLLGSLTAISFALTSAGAIWMATAIPYNSNGNGIADRSWEAFSVERVAELQREGRPVFVDFTAKWCLICQANHLVVATAEVASAMEKYNVVKMKADWTRSDPAITKVLRHHGRNGVPLYLLYSGSEGKEPEVLPQLLTPNLIVDALEKM